MRNQKYKQRTKQRIDKRKQEETFINGKGNKKRREEGKGGKMDLRDRRVKAIKRKYSFCKWVKEEELVGGEKEETKRIKICYVHIQILHD